MKDEFRVIFEEEERQKKKIEEVTDMNYEEAAERYEIGVIVPSSEAQKEHFKRLGKDKEYRKRYKGATSSKVEKQEAELGKGVLKTLADSL